MQSFEVDVGTVGTLEHLAKKGGTGPKSTVKRLTTNPMITNTKVKQRQKLENYHFFGPLQLEEKVFLLF